jgi:hypothetical protein
VFVYVDCCLYVLLVFIDIEMVFLYLVICFCLSTPGISCLSHYLTLTKVHSFSLFQIPALIAIHVYVVIYLCDSIWSVSESVKHNKLERINSNPIKMLEVFFFLLNFKSPCINPMTLSNDRCPIDLKQLL